MNNNKGNYALLGVVAFAFVLGLVLPGQMGARSLLGPSAQDETTPANRFITVTGDADVRVVPDEVLLTLGVETWHKDLYKAKKENDDIVGQVMDAIEGLGIESKYIQTDHVSIEPRYQNNYTKSEFVGYFVRKTMVVTLKDITLFEDLLMEVLEAGVTHVHGIQFRTTELRKYRDQARELAVNAAREKAEAMAAELGQEVGEPYDIREQYSGWWSWYNSWWSSSWGVAAMAQNVVVNAGDGAPDMDGTMAPGQIRVNAQVQVRFALK